MVPLHYDSGVEGVVVVDGGVTANQCQLVVCVTPVVHVLSIVIFGYKPSGSP